MDGDRAMTERIEIGKVCYKGNHESFAGEVDHGACGSHYYATLYLTVEVDYPGRGESPDLETYAAHLRELIEAGSEALEAKAWENYDKSMESDE